MKKSKFTDAKIVFGLYHSETGVKPEDVCRKIGIGKAPKAKAG